METNVTTLENLDYWGLNDQSASLILVESGTTKKPAPRLSSDAGMPLRTASDIERADYEAARQLGVQRKRQQAATAKIQSSGLAGNARSWIQKDPFNWRGRQVRHRNSGQVFIIRQVFKSGRVELKKSFMLYLTNVKAIRADYLAA